MNYVRPRDSAGKVKEVGLASMTVDVAASPRVPRTITWPEVHLPSRPADVNATIRLNLQQDADGSPEWTLNGKAMSPDPLFTWAQGSTVQLTLINKVNTEHLFHVHGQFFEILDDTQPGLADVVLVTPIATP